MSFLESHHCRGFDYESAPMRAHVGRIVFRKQLVRDALVLRVKFRFGGAVAEACGSRIETQNHKACVYAALHPHAKANQYKQYSEIGHGMRVRASDWARIGHGHMLEFATSDESNRTNYARRREGFLFCGRRNAE